MNELLWEQDPDSWVLDLGCGQGSFPYKECRARILAVDQHLSDPAEAVRRMAGGRVHYLRATGAQLPFASAVIDLVIANHVFEHVEQPQKLAQEVSRVLKPTGVLVATIPDGFCFSDSLYRWWTGGGGHIQRYTFRGFCQIVERTTDLVLLSACRLYSSFSFFHVDPQAAEHLSRRSGSFQYLPRLVRVGVLTAMNVATRTMDAVWGTHSSLYGWAFYFGKPEAILRAVQNEEHINVCAYCGCGQSAVWLDYKQKVNRRFGLPTYLCPACGCRNPYFGMGYVRRILGQEWTESEVENPPMQPRWNPPEKDHGSFPRIEKILDAFEFAEALAPGTLFAVFGEGLAPESQSAGAEQWPLELGDVQLLVNGQPIPLGSVAPTRILAQLPPATPRGVVSVTVRSQGIESRPRDVLLSLTAPVLPTENMGSPGNGLFCHHSTGEPVTRAKPAVPGEHITFRAIGLGPLAPPVPAGQPARAKPLSRTTRRAVVRIRELRAPVEFCGSAPGTIGFYQVNIRIPRGIAPGENPLVLEIGGRRSNTVMLSVRR